MPNDLPNVIAASVIAIASTYLLQRVLRRYGMDEATKTFNELRDNLIKTFESRVDQLEKANTRLSSENDRLVQQAGDNDTRIREQSQRISSLERTVGKQRARIRVLSGEEVVDD